MSQRVIRRRTIVVALSRGLGRAFSLSTPMTAALLACDPAPLPGPVGQPRYLHNQPAPIDDANDLALYVAQCEAVLGPIPEISCDPENPAPNTKVTRIPVLYEGIPLGFGDSRESDAILAQRRESGDRSCDFPSIGGDFPCTVGSTLVHYSDPENPNVQWVGLCRGVDEDVVSYDRFIGNGLIGANEKTGEMCFFFGGNPDPTADYELPRLTSDVPDGESLAPWLPPRDMPGSCLSCHPNNDPWIMTPWLQPEYMRQMLLDPAYPLALPSGVEIDDLLAARHIRQTPPGLKTMLPTPLPEDRTAWTEEEILVDGAVKLRQYRAVGSSYVANEAAGGVKPRTGSKPDSWSVNFRERLLLEPMATSCSSGCHAMANENFTRMAHDSLGSKYAVPYLTEMMSANDMPGFTWMPPVVGPIEPWIDLFERAEGPSIPAITECPIPKQVDVDPEVEIECDEGEGGYVTIRWTYENDYGDVPGRDDVRFDVALDIAANGEGGRGVAANSSLEGVAMEEDGPGVDVLRDLAPDPERPGQYELIVPFVGAQPNWSVDLQPKRFCFEEPDRRPFTYAPPHRVEIDVLAACG